MHMQIFNVKQPTSKKLLFCVEVKPCFSINILLIHLSANKTRFLSIHFWRLDALYWKNCMCIVLIHVKLQPKMKQKTFYKYTFAPCKLFLVDSSFSKSRNQTYSIIYLWKCSDIHNILPPVQAHRMLHGPRNILVVCLILLTVDIPTLSGPWSHYQSFNINFPLEFKIWPRWSWRIRVNQKCEEYIEK